MSACLFTAGVDSAEQLKSRWQVFPSSRCVGCVELHPDARSSRQRAGCSLALQPTPACMQLDESCVVLDGSCCFVTVCLPLGTFRGGKQVRDEVTEVKMHIEQCKWE